MRVFTVIFVIAVIGAIIPWQKNHYEEQMPKLEEAKSSRMVSTKLDSQSNQAGKSIVKSDSPKTTNLKVKVKYHSVKTPSRVATSGTNEKPSQTINNNGNLSMYQSGGTVNQYNVPELPDRELNDNDKEIIKSLIKPGYTIDMTIITSGSEETQAYGMQLLTYLQHTYVVSNSSLIGMSNENKRRGRKRFYYQIDSDKKIVYIFVQTQE